MHQECEKITVCFSKFDNRPFILLPKFGKSIVSEASNSVSGTQRYSVEDKSLNSQFQNNDLSLVVKKMTAANKSS